MWSSIHLLPIFLESIPNTFVPTSTSAVSTMEWPSCFHTILFLIMHLICSWPFLPNLVSPYSLWLWTFPLESVQGTICTHSVDSVLVSNTHLNAVLLPWNPYSNLQIPNWNISGRYHRHLQHTMLSSLTALPVGFLSLPATPNFQYLRPQVQVIFDSFLLLTQDLMRQQTMSDLILKMFPESNHFLSRLPPTLRSMPLPSFNWVIAMVSLLL